MPSNVEYWIEKNLNFRMSFPELYTFALVKPSVLTWSIQVKIEIIDQKLFMFDVFSVPNIWWWWRWSTELPGVHRHDEGPDPQGAEDLQQAGGVGGVQTVHQEGDEGVGLISPSILILIPLWKLCNVKTSQKKKLVKSPTILSILLFIVIFHKRLCYLHKLIQNYCYWLLDFVWFLTIWHNGKLRFIQNWSLAAS